MEGKKMQREAVTSQKIEQWKLIYKEYKDKIKPNRKTGEEIINYLKSKYELNSLDDDHAKEIVYQNVMQNKVFKNKLSFGVKPEPVTFYCIHNGSNLFIGIDLSSGFYHIEDDESLWDEICAFQGLDEDDIKNYYLVAEYISCLKKCGKLEAVLG